MSMRVLENEEHRLRRLNTDKAASEEMLEAGVDGRSILKSSEKQEEDEEGGMLEEPVAVTTLKRALRLIAWHFNWGFRFIFFSIPFFFYAAGLWALVGSSVLVLLFMVYFDNPCLTVPSSKYMMNFNHLDPEELNSRIENQSWAGYPDAPYFRRCASVDGANY